MTGPAVPPPRERPAATEPGAPAEAPRAAGDAPGDPHPRPRPYSPQGGPLGPLVGLDTIRDAVETTFATRIRAYVHAVAAERPHITNPPLADFHDWINAPSDSTPRPGEQPRFIVSVPGVLGPPRRKGDGTYAATFLVRVQIWLWGRDWRNATDRLGAYLAAARVCLLQNGSLGGVARSTTYRGETTTTARQDGTHNDVTGTLEVAVFVDPIANGSLGPAPLDPDQPMELPGPVRSVNVDLTAEPINDHRTP